MQKKVHIIFLNPINLIGTGKLTDIWEYIYKNNINKLTNSQELTIT